jgi:hypothetical protein
LPIFSLPNSVWTFNTTARRSSSELPPTVELLFLGARRFPDAAAEARILKLIETDVDWTYLLAQAGHHDVSSLLYFNLHNICRQGPPAAVMEALERHFHASAKHNLFLLGALLELVEKLEQAQIAVIPFKGPILAVKAFGDVSLREFSDLDLLIREQDIGRAQRLLTQLGFRYPFMAEWQEAYLRFGHELDFLSPEGAFKIDLQWRFAKKWLSFPLAPEALWERSSAIELAGRTVRQPSPEDYLLLLCGHAYRHCWSRLKWVSDVAAFIHTFGGEIDWQRLLQRARGSGGLRMLGLGLWLARQVCGAPLPSTVIGGLDPDPQIAFLGQRVIDGFAHEAGPMGPRGSAGFLANLQFQLRVRERMRDKLPRFRPLADHMIYQLRRYIRHFSRRLLRALARR